MFHEYPANDLQPSPKSPSIHPSSILSIMTSSDQLQRLANHHGFSVDAVQHVYQALRMGHGTMAQFSHPELGGTGQWMQGGMVMIGDMFNHGLKARIAALCQDLVQYMQEQSQSSSPHPWPFTQPIESPAWWPSELGKPTAQGKQNDLSYAYFARLNRLAIHQGNTLIVYDTTGYQITGFSQQQTTGLQGLYLNSPQGSIAVISLPIVRSSRS